MTQTDTWELLIWDLGFSADMLIKPKALVCMDLRKDVRFVPDAQVTRDGEGLLVFLMSGEVNLPISYFMIS